MKKSSRFWWLHGAILVAAIAGCKSNSCCNSNGYGSMGQGGPPPAVGQSGMVGSAGSTVYNQSATGGYPGASSMTSGVPGGATAMPGGPSFPTQTGGAYPGPGLSSGVGGH